jgi:hypothetical protein
MTAEVLALNKIAAAMAADSKGTVRIEGVIKTHDTVNKLFTLSKYHPVGVMIYGNAEILGVPWETVIKVYRDKLRSECFPRLNSYANDFVASLVNDYQRYAIDKQSGVHWMARDFVEQIIDDAEELLNRFPDIEADYAIDTASDWFSERVSEASVLFGFKSVTAAEILKLHEGAITSAFEAMLDSKFHEGFRKKIVELVAESFRRSIFSESRSGVVFAGFGDNEIFPAAKSFLIDGFVAGRLRAQISQKIKITDELTASIRPFAQSEMVYRFMEGIDPAYSRYLDTAYRGITSEIVDVIVDKYIRTSKAKKQVIISEIEKAVSVEMEKFLSRSKDYRIEKFADPIVSMAQLLPKEELAHLAESFVNLTSLKRRVSLDDESVGGPIDVAVISKGDGFVWIKRKHYFDKDLNGTFTANYFRTHVKAEGEKGRDRIRKSREETIAPQ